MSGGQHRVFVYGSLLRGLHNHHFLGASTLVGKAKTAEQYVLVDSGHGYPYALEAACARGIDAAAQLVGEVYEVTDAVLHENLDPLEDHPDIYRRRKVLKGKCTSSHIPTREPRSTPSRMLLSRLALSPLKHAETAYE